MTDSPQSAANPGPPATMRWVVRLLCLGAALQALFGGIMIYLVGGLRDDRAVHDEFARAARDAGKPASDVPGLIDDAIDRWRLAWIVATVLAVALWLFLAWINRRGFGWARTTTATVVVFALVFFVYVLLGGLNVVAIATIVLLAAILYLLYRPVPG
ncbi:hypothetical protein [Gordonia sp. (in: high G+C Gram-positive bacteria)]|uniref:hypothetical protein n=1 Tax=Gordonia sp. (in: high G+C Gram-positive bacteria) TaxID=84139 RepID=UPI0035290AB8